MTAGLLLGLGFALAVAAQPPPVLPNLDYSPESPGTAQIDAYLARKKSPMGGMGESFSTYAREYNVDPRLLVAIAGAETTFGGHVCAERNSWNWFYRRNCPQSPFPTYQAGLERVAKFMRLSYLNRGYDSIELIRYKYCATGCDHWIPLVSAFYREMPSQGAVASPLPPPAAISPVPVSQAPNPQAPPLREGPRIFGLPPFVLFFAAALMVSVWVSRSLFR